MDLVGTLIGCGWHFNWGWLSGVGTVCSGYMSGRYVCRLLPDPEVRPGTPGEHDPAKQLCPAERVSQKGKDACESILKQLLSLSGVDIQPRDALLIFDITPQSTNEWAFAVEAPFQSMPPTSTYKHFVIEFHECCCACLGRLTRSTNPTAQRFRLPTMGHVSMKLLPSQQRCVRI